MRILILGGHGFIGSHTSNLLKEKGHTIGVVDCYHQYFTFPDQEYFSILCPVYQCLKKLIIRILIAFNLEQ